MPFSLFFFYCSAVHPDLHSFPTRRSSDLRHRRACHDDHHQRERNVEHEDRSEEHTSELQSRQYLVCRLLLEKKNVAWSLAARAQRFTCLRLVMPLVPPFGILLRHHG